MPPNKESPARALGSATRLLELSYLDVIDGSYRAPNSAPNQAEILRNTVAVAAVRRELNLESLHECACGISIHAELIKTFADLGDVGGACYALKRLFAHAKAAHPVYVELRDWLAPIEERAP